MQQSLVQDNAPSSPFKLSVKSQPFVPSSFYSQPLLHGDDITSQQNSACATNTQEKKKRVRSKKKKILLQQPIIQPPSYLEALVNPISAQEQESQRDEPVQPTNHKKNQAKESRSHKPLKHKLNVTDQEQKPKKPNKLKKLILAERNQKQSVEDQVPDPNTELSQVIFEEDGKNEEEIIQSETLLAVQQPAKMQVIPREYVDYPLSTQLDTTVKELLLKLKEYQSRLYKTKPKKFKANRRFVLGLREVSRALAAKKLISVIVAPNIEKITTDGGLDTIVYNIITIAKQQEIPVVFALSKRKIAKIFGRIVKMSVIGIYSANGAHEEHKRMLELVKRARAKAAQEQVSTDLCSTLKDTEKI